MSWRDFPTRFVLGRQPCGEYRPQDDGPSGVGNVHECFAPYGSGREGEPRCIGKVSYCLNCHTDHHTGGWDICPIPANPAPTEPRP